MLLASYTHPVALPPECEKSMASASAKMFRKQARFLPPLNRIDPESLFKKLHNYASKANRRIAT